MFYDLGQYTVTATALLQQWNTFAGDVWSGLRKSGQVDEMLSVRDYSFLVKIDEAAAYGDKAETFEKSSYELDK